MIHLRESDVDGQTVGRPEPVPRPGRFWPLILAVISSIALFVGSSTLSGDRLAENESREPVPVEEARTGPAQTEWRRAPTEIAGLQPETLIATEYGFAVVSGPNDGAPAIWTSPTGATWEKTEMDAAPRGLATDGRDLLAYNWSSLWRLPFDGSTNHQPVRSELPTLARLGNLSHRPGIVSFRGTLLVQSPEGEVLAGTDEGSFTVVVPRGEWSLEADDPWRAATAPRRRDGCDPPQAGSLDYVPMIEAEGTLHAFVVGGDGRGHGVWPLCEPAVWTSTDGTTWTRAASAPFAPGEYVYDVAHRDGLFVAVGGIGADRPAMWTSENALTWTRVATVSIPDFQAFEPTQVAAGGSGWVVLGSKPNSPDASGWISLDGQCWQQLPLEIEARRAAVSDARMVVTARDGTVWHAEPAARCG